VLRGRGDAEEKRCGEGQGAFDQAELQYGHGLNRSSVRAMTGEGEKIFRPAARILDMPETALHRPLCIAEER
jgi:hypothetical protein